MLRTLLESRSRRQSNSFGTAASTAVHIVLITAAAYGTITHARAEEAEEPAPVVLRWHGPDAPPAAQPSRRVTVRDHGVVQVARGPAISLDISPQIPDVNIPLGGVRHDDFPATSGVTSDPGAAPAGLTSGARATPYDSYEVDVPVASLGGTAPVYPPALRSAGVEGEVKAEFVVDKKGKADAASLRIISATNELFSGAVKDALLRMRFAPARLKGEPVAQLVQQLFVFRLSR